MYEFDTEIIKRFQTDTNDYKRVIHVYKRLLTETPF